MSNNILSSFVKDYSGNLLSVAPLDNQYFEAKLSLSQASPIKNLIEELVEEEVLLQINPNLYLLNVLNDIMPLKINNLQRVKEIIKNKG